MFLTTINGTQVHYFIRNGVSHHQLTTVYNSHLHGFQVTSCIICLAPSPFSFPFLNCSLPVLSFISSSPFSFFDFELPAHQKLSGVLQRSDIKSPSFSVFRKLVHAYARSAQIICTSGSIRCARCLTSDVCHQISYVWHETSNIRHLTSDVRHQTSDTRHKTSDVWYQTSDLRHHISDVWHQTFVIGYRTSGTSHQMSHIWHQTSDIRHKTSDLQQHISDVWHQIYVWHETSNIKHQTKDIRPPTACIRRLTSDIRY